MTEQLIMNSTKELSGQNEFVADGGDVDIFKSIRAIISFPVTAESRQIIHKLNRVLVEIEFAKKNRHKFDSLTQREKEIITLIVLGNNNPQISAQLFISRCTVEQHRKNINRKLNMHTLSDLCVFAYAFNLV
jgi:DNA-binding NarL/FixJ family response regulator